jgi:hypothetical protein
LNHNPVFAQGKKTVDGCQQINNYLTSSKYKGIPLNYLVQASTNLSDWVILPSDLLPGELFDFSDTNAPHFRQRFYRAVEAP